VARFDALPAGLQVCVVGCELCRLGQQHTQQQRAFRELSTRSLARRWAVRLLAVQHAKRACLCTGAMCLPPKSWGLRDSSARLARGTSRSCPRLSTARRRSEWVHLEGDFAGIMLVIMPCRSEKSQQGVAK
jgi:hypothetical protein